MYNKKSGVITVKCLHCKRNYNLVEAKEEAEKKGNSHLYCPKCWKKVGELQ